LFLSKSERDFLLNSGRESSKAQQRHIRYKLRRKIKQFYDVELPLLVDRGYIVNNNGSAVAAAATYIIRTNDNVVTITVIMIIMTIYMEKMK
jgi:hypothetical protein